MAYVAILGGKFGLLLKQLIIWSLKTFDKVFQGKWSCALIIAWSSPRATSFPSTPVLSHPCLNKGLSTANLSCLGGRWLSVVEGMTSLSPLTPASLGLQDKPAGLTFTTWGTSQHLVIQEYELISPHFGFLKQRWVQEGQRLWSHPFRLIISNTHPVKFSGCKFAC